MSENIKVTVHDLKTGEQSSEEIMDDFTLVVAGTAHVTSVQWSPSGTTAVIVVEGVKARKS
jgi:hypothetical protein